MESFPGYLNVPDESFFAYMIYRLAKAYGISKRAAGRHKEYDFWEMTMFESLDAKKEEYLIRIKSD